MVASASASKATGNRKKYEDGTTKKAYSKAGISVKSWSICIFFFLHQDQPINSSPEKVGNTDHYPLTESLIDHSFELLTSYLIRWTDENVVVL